MSDKQPAFALPTRPTGKRLTRTGADVYKLTWPFLLWSALILIVYGISYSAFSSVDQILVDIKMGQWTAFQSSRVLYYANEVALGQVTLHLDSLE